MVVTRPTRPKSRRRADPTPVAPTGAADTARLCVGVIAGRHGVRGAVKIKPFTDRADGIADLPGLEDEAGRPVAITVQ